jgi:hypothetical protein
MSYRNRCKIKHPAAEQMPDYLSPFTAYRAWQWDAEGIKSLNHAPWIPGVAFEATCQAMEQQRVLAAQSQAGFYPMDELHDMAGHRCPGEDCTCGMYAAINFQHLININYAQQGIHGEVLLWGKLLKHTLGWRAQYAYPKYFIVPPDMVPFSMVEVDARFKSLIAFNVDIHLQASSTPTVGGATVPLWIKDFGWSQQGFAHLIDIRKKWYESSPKCRKVEVGERLSVKDKGIGIVRHIEGDNIFITLFTKQVYRYERKQIEWSRDNWRWETAAPLVSRHIATIGI